MLVEQEEHFNLARGERRGDRVGNPGLAAAAVSHLLEEPAGDGARQRRVALRGTAEILDDPLGRLALQQVAGGAAPDRAEQVVLGPRGGQDDHLAPGRRLTQARQRLEPVHARHREVEQDQLGLQPACELDRLLPVRRLAGDREAVPVQQGRERFARERVVVDDQDPGRHGRSTLIGGNVAAEKGYVTRRDNGDYQSWLFGQVLLLGLLGAGLALFVAYPQLRSSYDAPQARLVLDTTVTAAAMIVAG